MGADFLTFYFTLVLCYFGAQITCSFLAYFELITRFPLDPQGLCSETECSFKWGHLWSRVQAQGNNRSQIAWRVAAEFHSHTSSWGQESSPSLESIWLTVSPHGAAHANCWTNCSWVAKCSWWEERHRRLSLLVRNGTLHTSCSIPWAPPRREE